MTDVPNLSPAECLLDVITRLGPADLAPSGAVVGPATDAQQQAGVIQIVDAGLPVIEQYRPVVWVRHQYRCLAGSLGASERIARRLQFFLNALPARVLARQDSTNETYLLHNMTVSAGTSMHYDTPETWENLLFTECLMSLEPVG